MGEHKGGVVRAEHVRLGAGSGGFARQALKEGLAGEVEVDAGAFAADGEGDARVRMLGVDVGAGAGLVCQAVADSVFHAQRGVVRVAQFFVGATGGHGDAGASDQDRFPGHVVGAVIQGVGVPAIKAAKDHKDAAGQARPQAGAVGVGNRTSKGDAALKAAGLAQAHGAQLRVKRAFEPLRAAGVELQVCRGERGLRCFVHGAAFHKGAAMMPMLRGLLDGIGAGAYVFKVPLSHSGARGSSPPPDRYNMGG